MPTIDISLKDLNTLLKKEVTREDLEQEGIFRVKGEIDGVENDTIKIDCKDTNRPDLWSTEGIARVLSTFYTEERGIREYKVEPSDLYLHIDRSVDDIRPYMVLAIAENVTITDNLIKQLVQLQEKMSLTFGRKRKVLGAGIFDLDKVKGPLTYKAVKPTSVKFAPLGFENEMTLKEVLETHPKGIEYADILKRHDKYPILIDSTGNILTMPPITNSNDTGKVTEKTKNLLIEVTGTNLEAVQVGLRIFTAAIADRGARIKSVTIDYGEKKLITPDFTPKKIKVSFTEIDRITGLKLSLKEMKELLEKMCYNVKKAKNSLEVEYPAFRQDILHPIDVIEDLLISYGYNEIPPTIPAIATVGDIDPLENFCEDLRNLLVGFGANEILNFTLTDKENQFSKMQMEEETIVEIDNPVSQRWSCLRRWIIPSLLQFFEKNTTQEYPQQIYELGEVVIPDTDAMEGSRTIKHLAWALAAKEAPYTKARQMLDFTLQSLDRPYEITAKDHPSFIPGRCAQVNVNKSTIGFLGELHPHVLTTFGIEFPVCTFEINVTALFKQKK